MDLKEGRVVKKKYAKDNTEVLRNHSDQIKKEDNLSIQETDELIDLCEEVEIINDVQVQKDLFENSFSFNDMCENLRSCDTTISLETTSIKENQLTYTTETGREMKRKLPTEDEVDNSTSDGMLPGQSTSSNQQKNSNQDTVVCELCKVRVRRRYLSKHLNRPVHKNKVLSSKHDYDNVTVIHSSFGSRIATYQITLPPNHKNRNSDTPELFFECTRDTISSLVNKCLKEMKTIKINFEMFADFVQVTNSLENIFDFRTTNYTLSLGDNLRSCYKSLRETIKSKLMEFESKNRGWSFKSIRYLKMNVNQFSLVRGSSYIKLPSDIQAKKAVINVKNNDHECFKWALLSALYPTSHHVDRVTSYYNHRNKLNFRDVPFPVKLKDVAKVESNNDISINVYGIEYSETLGHNVVVGPLYFTKQRKEKHVNLLYVTFGRIGHYCYIKNLSRLVRKQLTGKANAISICDGCLLYFPTKERLQIHQKQECH